VSISSAQFKGGEKKRKGPWPRSLPDFFFFLPGSGGRRRSEEIRQGRVTAKEEEGRIKDELKKKVGGRGEEMDLSAVVDSLGQESRGGRNWERKGYN